MVNGGGRTRDIKIMSLALCQLSYVTENVVDQGRLELPTSRLSAECSSQLSYRSKLNLDPRRAVTPKELRLFRSRGRPS